MKDEKVDSDKSQIRKLHFELTNLTLLKIIIVIISFLLISRLLPVILIIITSLILVGALAPAVKWLEEHKFKRGWSIAVVFSSLLIITCLFIFLTVPQIIQQVENLIKNEAHLRTYISSFLSKSGLTSPLASYIQKFNYNSLIKSSVGSAFEISEYILELMAYGVAVIFLALYVMIDRDRLQGGLFAIVPRSHHIRLSRVLLNLENIVGGYIRGQLFTCILLSSFIFILLWFFGIPNALTLALFGGLADVLPYVGIFLTMAPVVIAALSKGTLVALTVFILMFVYEEFEGRVLIPVIYGRALRLPSSIILVSLFTGTALLGVIGALLALPFAAAIRMMIIELRVDLPGETEKSEDIELKKKDEVTEKEYEKRTEGLDVVEAAAIAIEISNKRKEEETNDVKSLDNDESDI